MSAGTAGRPALPDAVVVYVRSLHADRQLTQRDIVAECQAAGTPVSKTSVQRILAGQHVALADPSLAAGEMRLSTPTTCPRGHLIDVAPCRTCSLMDGLNELQRRGNIAKDKKAAGQNKGTSTPRRTRSPLSSQLPADAEARRAEIFSQRKPLD